MSTYRLAPGPALYATGTWTAVTGVLVVAAFLLAGIGGWGRPAAAVAAALAVGALLFAARFAIRPPVVISLDETGLRSRRSPQVAWTDVEGVSLDRGVLRLEQASGSVVEVALSVIRASDQPGLVREVYERLNAAHGYQRFG